MAEAPGIVVLSFGSSDSFGVDPPRDLVAEAPGIVVLSLGCSSLSLRRQVIIWLQHQWSFRRQYGCVQERC